jgi:hypothetical protein
MIHLSLVFNTFLFNLARILDVLLTEQGKKERNPNDEISNFFPSYIPESKVTKKEGKI